jgi:predicted alpha/beta hydrolase
VRDWLRERRAGEPVWAGHSYGGHLAAAHVAAHPRGDAALILLASSDIGFRHWGTSALGILGTTQLCAALAALLGYFPGHKLGMGRPIARTVIFDWARWARTGRFRGSDGTDYGRLLSAASARVLSISFTDDQRMARRSAVDALARRFGNAEVTRWHLTPEEVGRAKVGHFGFLEEAEGFWRRIGEWVDGLEPVRRQELGSGAGDRLGEQP